LTIPLADKESFGWRAEIEDSRSLRLLEKRVNTYANRVLLCVGGKSMEPEFKSKLLEFSFPSPELRKFANLTRYTIFLKFCKSFYTLIRGFKILGLILFHTITIWWQIGDSNCPQIGK
jgi:hypothetical protein